MPQSTDYGKHITYMPTCNDCKKGWWDNADWNGSHLEKSIK